MSVADSGERGVQLGLENPPDLILLDMLMPGLTGEQVLEKLRADQTTASLPVVMVTVKSGIVDLKKIAPLKISGYIKKPFTRPGILESKVKEILGITETVE